jgi:hypothetical protein
MQSAGAVTSTNHLRFEPTNKGDNLEIVDGGITARRTVSFNKGATYIASPLTARNITLRNAQLSAFKVSFTILEDANWAGGLKVGFTATNPSTIDLNSKHISDLPSSVIADFDRTQVSCLATKAILPKTHGVDDVVSVILTSDYRVFHVEFNHALVLSVNAPAPLGQAQIYFIVELYGQTQSIRLEAVPDSCAASPSTPAPTTRSPSTPAPTTPAPTTPTPTTRSPSTPAPTTPAPTTRSSSSALVTQAPLTAQQKSSSDSDHELEIVLRVSAATAQLEGERSSWLELIANLESKIACMLLAIAHTLTHSHTHTHRVLEIALTIWVDVAALELAATTTTAAPPTEANTHQCMLVLSDWLHDWLSE